MMNLPIILLPILLPALGGFLCFCLGRRFKNISLGLSLLIAAVNLWLCVILFRLNINYVVPWLGNGLDFSLRLYQFSSFILLASGFFAFLISLFCTSYLRRQDNSSQACAYILLSLAFVNGAVLADSLLVLLFFWESLLLALFGFIIIGKAQAFKTATKTFIIVGISDLCMMMGIGLAWYLSGTLTISQINLPINTLSSIAFILLIIGAISKGGSMPFHSWIPDAATDAPLPFMAFLPACLEKLLGIYFLTRICMDMFKLDPHSSLSVLLMAIGAITIILAVMMALVQKDYKRLLSYHAISQVGYMILGVGTCLPIGIVGGLFHMINNALYKSCLFLTAGSVQQQSGTSDLERLGGLRTKMPITFICFVITAASISGVPPFNGFFSKELVMDAAWERGMIFYLAAVVGAFLTAASFLKLGHSAFLGKMRQEYTNVKEAPIAMLVPMIIIAAVCIIFGVYNFLPLKYLIQPVLGERLAGENFVGWPTNTLLVTISIVVLLAALIHHILMARAKGSGLKAADDIHYAPLLSVIYEQAEKGRFDPYEIGQKFAGLIAQAAFWLDRKVDWFYNDLSVGLAYSLSRTIRWMHTGNYVTYLFWILIASFLVVFKLVK